MANDSTRRFSNRVEDYVKYRPGYPSVIVDYLQDKYSINTKSIIADIGAGTGISSQLFLDKGYTVIAVEPNKEMREKAVELLQFHKGFSVTSGTAEDTLLADKQIDMIIAGQAFHWFNVGAAKKEFQRILKTKGIVALIWNERLAKSAFEQEYDQLIIKYASDYTKIDHRNIDFDKIKTFFHPQTCELRIFPNHQDFDFTGLKGRLLSSSYMPLAGEPGFDAMLTDLSSLFQKYQQNNMIRIGYETKLYSGMFK